MSLTLPTMAPIEINVPAAQPERQFLLRSVHSLCIAVSLPICAFRSCGLVWFCRFDLQKGLQTRGVFKCTFAYDIVWPSWGDPVYWPWVILKGQGHSGSRDWKRGWTVGPCVQNGRAATNVDVNHMRTSTAVYRFVFRIPRIVTRYSVARISFAGEEKGAVNQDSTRDEVLWTAVQSEHRVRSRSRDPPWPRSLRMTPGQSRFRFGDPDVTSLMNSLKNGRPPLVVLGGERAIPVNRREYIKCAARSV